MYCQNHDKYHSLQKSFHATYLITAWDSNVKNCWQEEETPGLACWLPGLFLSSGKKMYCNNIILIRFQCFAYSPLNNIIEYLSVPPLELITCQNTIYKYLYAIGVTAYKT